MVLMHKFMLELYLTELFTLLLEYEELFVEVLLVVLEFYNMDVRQDTRNSVSRRMRRCATRMNTALRSSSTTAMTR